MATKLKLIFASILLIASFIVVVGYQHFHSAPYFSSRIKPQSSPKVVSKQYLVKKNIVLWGKVVNKERAPLANILVRIAGRGNTTDSSGNYIIALDNDTLQGTVLFYDTKTGEAYEQVDTSEQAIYLSPGQNLHQDFVVEKVPPTQ